VHSFWRLLAMETTTPQSTSVGVRQPAATRECRQGVRIQPRLCRFASSRPVRMEHVHVLSDWSTSWVKSPSSAKEEAPATSEPDLGRRRSLKPPHGHSLAGPSFMVYFWYSTTIPTDQ